MRRFASVAFLLVSALTCRAEKDLPSPDFAEGSGFEMKLTGGYESIPPTGFFPVRVKVENPTGAAKQWQIRSTQRLNYSQSMSSVTSIDVPAETTKTFDLLFPLAPDLNTSSRYSNLEFRISGPGIVQGNSYLSDSGSSRTPTAFLGMGEALSVTNWGPLQSAIEKNHSKSLQGTPLDMTFMPANWRALAGFQLIVLTGEEWRGLLPECREALSDWVIQGGGLILAGDTVQAATDLPPAGPSGTGMIEYWPDLDSFPAKIASKLAEFPDDNLVRPNSGRGAAWPLARKIGEAQSPGVLILCFVVIFAIVIGPVNFLVFAPAGRRHRLFWTIPVLSLLASLLMGTYILLREGIGGSGLRYTARLSLPSSHKLVTWQEQISRTGVLTGSSFSLPNTTLPTPIPLTSEGSLGFRSGALTYDAGTWGGDWFKSRTTQAQLFVEVGANRERIETSTTDGGVSITSSFSSPLSEIWYIDESGQVWHGRKIRPGETLPLTRGTMGDLNTWKARALENADPSLRSLVNETYGVARGRFFATPEGDSGINSLSSIRWKDAGGILFGETLKKP